MDAKLFNGATLMKKKKCPKNKSILVMCDCLVSMETHYANLENGGVSTKILKSQQQLILVY